MSVSATAVQPSPLAEVLDRSRKLVEASAIAISTTERLRAELHEAKRRRVVTMDRVEQRIDLARAWCTVPGAGSARQFAPGVKLAIWMLHVRYARTKDGRVMAELVEEYQTYALGLARRMHRKGESIDDLRQVALEGLVRSVERFDPTQSVPFPAFATPTIIGALKRHFRDRGYAVRLPRRLQEIDAAARQAHDRLTGVLTHEPSEEEIAEVAGLTVDDIREAARGVEARRVASLDQPPYGDRPVQELGRTDPSFARAENIVALREVLDCLGERDRQVLGLYYFDELSQQAIAERFGVSQMQVSRWITRSLKQLRSHLGVR